MPDFDMPATGSWEQRGGWVVRRLMADVHLLAFQGAGLVGGFGYESNGFQTLQEGAPVGGRGGWGWAQWTGPRRRKFEAWARASKLAPDSDEANYGFVLVELRGAYKGFLANLQKTASLEEATHLAHKDYETPSDAIDGSFRSGPDRLRWAARALAGAQEPVPTPAPPAEVISAFDRLKAIQVVLGVKPDADFGKATWAAMNALLEAAGQPGVE